MPLCIYHVVGYMFVLCSWDLVPKINYLNYLTPLASAGVVTGDLRPASRGTACPGRSPHPVRACPAHRAGGPGQRRGATGRADRDGAGEGGPPVPLPRPPALPRHQVLTDDDYRGDGGVNTVACQVFF